MFSIFKKLIQGKSSKVGINFKNKIDSHRKIREEKSRIRILNKVDNQLNSGCLDNALNSLTGFLQQHPTDQVVHEKLGELFLKNNDLINAGKHLYFKISKDDAETEAVERFKSRYGNSTIEIAKKLIYKDNYKISFLSDHILREYYRMIEEINMEIGKTPSFLKAVEEHANKRLNLSTRAK